MSTALDISQYALEEARGSSPLRWNLPVSRLSPSSITMLRRCPRQWQERYIFGRKERPAEAPLIGSAVHLALKENFTQKITSGEDMPVADLLAWYSEVGFPTAVVEREEESEMETFWETEPDYVEGKIVRSAADKARTRGRVMLGAYRNEVTPRIQPTSAESKFEIDMGLPVPVMGIYDVETDDTVIDIKTGKKRRYKPKEDWRIQAGVYSTARQRPVEFHCVAASGEKNVASIVTPLESEHLLIYLDAQQQALLRESIRAIAAEAVMYMDMYGTDSPWPTHGTHSEWACGYCGFRSNCPAWEHERA